jgi:hypothetical protein
MTTTRPRSAATTDLRTAPARVFGSTIKAEFVLHDSELARRAHFDLGAVADAATITALAGLPAGEGISWAALSRSDQRTLRRSAPGCVERAGSTVTRLLRQPITVQMVTLTARAAQTALQTASKFAPYCQRTVVLPRGAITECVRLEAAFYGIGLALPTDGEHEYVVDPAPFRIERWTWAWWLFQERAWAQLRPEIDSS